ncbi:MAG: hypothetical protein ACK5XV_08100 [Flavobacteriales bacterium]|jgi:hypothetical protein
MLRNLLLISGICLIALAGLTQADSLMMRRGLELKGYVKHLHQASFEDRVADLHTGDLLHNRMQLRYGFRQGLSARVDVRNRIFYGEEVRLNPAFAAMLENPNDYMDLTRVWYSRGSIIAHTVVDRACVSFTSEKWELTAGRQRINWGVTTLWTPNDLFNTYNFFDFDYEERPGSDAVHIQYSPGGFSALEIAYKAGHHRDEHIAAMLWRFNRWNFDFQFFGGILNADATAGGGWAGRIGNAGFKGETTVLIPVMNGTPDSTTAVLGTIMMDYVFTDGWYVSGAYLYNQAGTDAIPSISGFYVPRLTLRNLMPFRHSWSSMVSKAITPILTATGVVIYSPASSTLIAVPSLNYSIADAWDVYLTGQVFLAKQDSGYGSLGHTIFLRLKVSF